MREVSEADILMEKHMASLIPNSSDRSKLGSLQSRTIEKGIVRVAMPGV